MNEMFKQTPPLTHGIYSAMNGDYLKGDNEKFQKTYDWMSRGYDIAELVIGKLKYGNQVSKVRDELMGLLEWKNNLSVLYVSIGTGNNLEHIPKSIDLASLDFYGLDISMGMLKKCQKKHLKQPNIKYVHSCAEDLPFNDGVFDVVFHFGGINFFLDKKKALAEMVRVAKVGSKLMVADETSDYIDKQYKKSFLSRRQFKDASFCLDDIAEAIPIDVKDKDLHMLWDKKIYAYTFRK